MSCQLLKRSQQEVKEYLHLSRDIKVIRTQVFYSILLLAQTTRVTKPLSKALSDFMFFSTFSTSTSKNNPFCSLLKVLQAESQWLALCHIATLTIIINRPFFIFLVIFH